MWWSPKARGCFADNSAFRFEPDRHIQILPVTNTLAIIANRSLAEAISHFENVVAVQRDLRLGTLIQKDPFPPGSRSRLVPRDPEARHVEGYTWGWHRLGIPALHTRGIRGKGVVIGMIDTGVREQHADLRFKVKDFAIAGPPAGLVTPSHSFDHHGHGTFCAGIMVGAANSGVQIGGAPDAELKTASIMNPMGWWSSFLAAAEWLTDPYRAAQVVNVSMGVKDVTREDADLFESVVAALLRHRTVFVGAIGNEATESCYPARLKSVLGAGAFKPDGERWGYSGGGPDLLMPGVDVFSCVPAGLSDYHGVSYAYRDGTSCVAPHLSALMALLIEACPRVPPWRIVQALKKTTDRRGCYHNEQGLGIPRVEFALEDLAKNNHN